MKMLAGVLVELSAEEREPKIADIQRIVGSRYGVSAHEIRSMRQSAAVLLARHVAVFIAKQLTLHSLPAIGRHFGNRDHTTILQCIRKIDAMQRADLDLAATIQKLSWVILDRNHPNIPQAVHSFDETQLSFLSVLSP